MIFQKINWNSSIKHIWNLLLAFLGTYYLPYLFTIEVGNLAYSNSIFSVLLFAVLAKIIYEANSFVKWESKRQWGISILFGAVFTLCMVFGKSLKEIEYIEFMDRSMWAAVVVYTVIVSLLVMFAWDKLECFNAGREEKREIEGLSDKKTVIITALCLLICWLPVFLSVYPGFFVYDAQDEYIQVATRNFSSHHPLMHVLMLGGIIHLIYKITGSYNLGIACYTLFQMVILSGILSYALLVMKKKGTSFFIRIVWMLYFGLFPVIVMFSLCSAKDGLFTGMLLLLFLFLRELCKNPEKFFASKYYKIAFFITAVGMMLLRHNGVYAYLVLAVLLYFIYTKYRKEIGILLFSAVLVYYIVNSAMIFIFSAYHGEKQEILTVPIQQMARVYNSEKDELPIEDLQTLYEILPEYALRFYTPKVSDGVKYHFNNEAFSKDPGKYLTLWMRWGIKHPFTYLNAWFMTSYGFWYPDTVIDVYRGTEVFTYTYEDSSYFGYEVEEPGERASKFPWFNEIYRKLSLEIAQQKLPVISMLFSPGFLFWIMAFTMGYLWYFKRYNDLLPFLLPMLVWLTVLLGPTYLVRYVLFLWFLLPFMIRSLFDKSDKL